MEVSWELRGHAWKVEAFEDCYKQARVLVMTWGHLEELKCFSAACKKLGLSYGWLVHGPVYCIIHP